MSKVSGPTRRPARRSTPVSAERRRRVRRAVAMGGILVAGGGIVGVRATLTPTPNQALSSSGLAAPVNQGPTSSGAQRRVGSHSGGVPSGRTPRPVKRRQVLGSAYDVTYGVVQVRVILDGKRITDVSPVSLPQGGRSGDISRYAVPQLRREALSAQSARIDTVSGASYTSAGYARSLQSALDKAAS